MVLAYLCRNSASEEREASHYPCLIRTFRIFTLAVMLQIATLIAIIANQITGARWSSVPQ